MEKNRLEKQRKVLDIRIAYTDKFGKVLSGSQLTRLYKEENLIQKRLKNELRQAMRELKTKRAKK